MMINPIHRSNLFETPMSAEELFAMTESMSNRAEAWQVLMFTMNYCHRIVAEEMELSKSPKQYKLVTG
jgi:hypothetical protein